MERTGGVCVCGGGGLEGADGREGGGEGEVEGADGRGGGGWRCGGYV